MSSFLALRNCTLYRTCTSFIVQHERLLRRTIGASSKGKRRRHIGATINFDNRFAPWIKAGNQSRGLSLRSDSSAKRPVASVRQRHGPACICSNRCRSRKDEARRHRTCVARFASCARRISSAERTAKTHPRHRTSWALTVPRVCCDERSPVRICARARCGCRSLWWTQSTHGRAKSLAAVRQ